MKQEVVLFWLRRDLRWHDNVGLTHALQSGFPVVPVFFFDPNILNELDDKSDARVSFIHGLLTEMQNTIVHFGSSLQVLHQSPVDAFQILLSTYDVKAVFTNKDYEPYALQRDETIKSQLASQGIPFHAFKDQVIFEEAEIVKDDGKPYTVFTPFSKKWKSKLQDHHTQEMPSAQLLHQLLKQPPIAMPSLAEMGFEQSSIVVANHRSLVAIAPNYADTRNLPAIEGTTYLSPHLRFGSVSVRQMVKTLKSFPETLLNELIWREFFMMILWHFPHTVNKSFKPAYDQIVWNNNQQDFERWCAGKTGYPIVDAGMRELNNTGWMHNRVRMITASFLCKHLLIDWRWGEAYFAKKLLDFDLAQNVGNWQWVAGTGVDAAPYFRIFNPTTQQEKFDPKQLYIKKWIPEFGTAAYPKPVVIHEQARARCLEKYAVVKQALTTNAVPNLFD